MLHRNMIVINYYKIWSIVVDNGGMRWYSWLSHCATSLTVACSIPKGGTEIFYRLNLSGPTMALGSVWPLIKMSTKDVSWE